MKESRRGGVAISEPTLGASPRTESRTPPWVEAKNQVEGGTTRQRRSRAGGVERSSKKIQSHWRGDPYLRWSSESITVRQHKVPKNIPNRSPKTTWRELVRGGGGGWGGGWGGEKKKKQFLFFFFVFFVFFVMGWRAAVRADVFQHGEPSEGPLRLTKRSLGSAPRDGQTWGPFCDARDSRQLPTPLGIAAEVIQGVAGGLMGRLW